MSKCKVLYKNTR